MEMDKWVKLFDDKLNNQTLQISNDYKKVIANELAIVNRKLNNNLVTYSTDKIAFQKTSTALETRMTELENQLSLSNSCQECLVLSHQLLQGIVTDNCDRSHRNNIRLTHMTTTSHSRNDCITAVQELILNLLSMTLEEADFQRVHITGPSHDLSNVTIIACLKSAAKKDKIVSYMPDFIQYCSDNGIPSKMTSDYSHETLANRHTLYQHAIESKWIGFQLRDDRLIYNNLIYEVFNNAVCSYQPGQRDSIFPQPPPDPNDDPSNPKRHTRNNLIESLNKSLVSPSFVQSTYYPQPTQNLNLSKGGQNFPTRGRGHVAGYYNTGGHRNGNQYNGYIPPNFQPNRGGRQGGKQRYTSNSVINPQPSTSLLFPQPLIHGSQNVPANLTIQQLHAAARQGAISAASSTNIRNQPSTQNQNAVISQGNSNANPLNTNYQFLTPIIRIECIDQTLPPAPLPNTANAIRILKDALTAVETINSKGVDSSMDTSGSIDLNEQFLFQTPPHTDSAFLTPELQKNTTGGWQFSEDESPTSDISTY